MIRYEIKQIKVHGGRTGRHPVGLLGGVGGSDLGGLGLGGWWFGRPGSVMLGVQILEWMTCRGQAIGARGQCRRGPQCLHMGLLEAPPFSLEETKV